MAEQRDDMTPEECKQRYDEYKADYTQRLTHSFIDVHHNEVRCTTTRQTRFCCQVVAEGTDFRCHLHTAVLRPR